MKELKTCSTTVLLTPTDYSNMKKLAGLKQTNFSVLVGEIIKHYLEDNQELLKQYSKLFKE